MGVVQCKFLLRSIHPPPMAPANHCWYVSRTQGKPWYTWYNRPRPFLERLEIRLPNAVVCDDAQAEILPKGHSYANYVSAHPAGELLDP